MLKIALQLDCNEAVSRPPAQTRIYDCLFCGRVWKPKWQLRCLGNTELENALQAWNLCGINEREQASRPTQAHNWERQRHCQRYDLKPDPIPGHAGQNKDTYAYLADSLGFATVYALN